MAHITFLMTLNLLYGSLLIRNPYTGVQELKHYHWSYHGESGPLHWYKNFFHCGGRRQSPINIMTSEVEPVTWLNHFQFTGYEKISGQGRPVFMTLRNNGHTASMAIQDDIFIQGSNLRDRFQMAEIHFHWGEDSRHGSEHSIDGTQSPLEMHFVHFNTKYGNLSKAMLQPDGLAVIGIFAEIVPEDNLAFDHISQAVGKISHYDAKTKVTGIRPTDLLPGDTSKYFHYLGSLTTPPCYESVLWYVMAEKYRLSQRQINRFKRLRQQLHPVNSTASPHAHTGSVQNQNHHSHSTHNTGPKHERDKYIVSNFRPTQPLNRRTVFCSHPTLRSTQPNIPNNYQAAHHPTANFRMGPQSVKPAPPNSLVRESFGKRLNNNNGNRFLNMGATKAANSATGNSNNINGLNKMEIRFGGDAGMKKLKIAQGKPTSTTVKATQKTTYPGLKTTQRSPLSLLDKVTNSYSLFSNKFLHGKFKIDKDALLKTFATLLIQQTKQLALTNQRKSFQNPTGIREFSNPLTGRMKTLTQQNQQSAALRHQNRMPVGVTPTTPSNKKIPQSNNQAPVNSAQAIVTTSKPLRNTSPHTTVTAKPTPPTRKPWVDPEIFPTLPNGALNNSLPSSMPLAPVTQNQSPTAHIQVQNTKIPPTPIEPNLPQVQNTVIPPTPVYPHLKQFQSTNKPSTPYDPHLMGVQNTNIPLSPIAPYIQQVQNANIPLNPIKPHVQNTHMSSTPTEPSLQQVQNKIIQPNSVEPYLQHIQNPNTEPPIKTIIQHVKIPPTSAESYLNVPNAELPQTPVKPNVIVPSANLPPTQAEPYLHGPNLKIPQTPLKPNLIVPNANLPTSPVEPYLHGPNANVPQTPAEPYLHGPNSNLPPTPLKPNLIVPNSNLPPTPAEPYLHGPNAKLPHTPLKPNLIVPNSNLPPTPAEPYLHGSNVNLPQTPAEPYLLGPNSKVPPTPAQSYNHVPNAKLSPTPVEPYLTFQNANLPQTPVKPNLNVLNAKLPSAPAYLNIPNEKLQPTPAYLNIPNEKLPATPVESYIHVPNEKLPATIDPYLQHGQLANLPQTLFEPFLQEGHNVETFTPTAVVPTATVKPLNNQGTIPLQNVKDVLPKPAKNLTIQPLHKVIQPVYQKHEPNNENLPEGGNINGVTKADLRIITQAFESQHADSRVPIPRQRNNHQRWNEPKYINNPFPSNVPSFPQNMQNEFNNYIENQNPNVVPTMENTFTLPEKSAFRTNERPYKWEISTVPPHVRKWLEPGQQQSNPTPSSVKESERKPPSPPTAQPAPTPIRDFVMQYHLGFFSPMKRDGGPIISLPPSPQSETTDQSWPRENSHRRLSLSGGSLSMMSGSDIFPDGVVPNHWPSDQRASHRQDKKDIPDVVLTSLQH